MLNSSYTPPFGTSRLFRERDGGTILAIESSCDDTGAAVCVDGKILSNFIANQKVHEKYGGVVPELASRAHMQNIVPVVDTALKEAGVNLDNIDASRSYFIGDKERDTEAAEKAGVKGILIEANISLKTILNQIA